jgi:proteic killer suppression protein
MIISFRDRQAEAIANGLVVKQLPFDMQRTALKKLRQLAAASLLEDLRVPPGNRLEALQGSRKGQWSIRINDQWRLCFRWQDGNAHQVEIVDYH